MYIETVSQSAVAVCLSAQELDCLGVTGPVGSRAAREIIRGIQKNGGQSPWDDMEIELFESHGSTLIIARPASETICVLELCGVEELIGAVLSCPVGLQSSVHFMDGQYYLALRCSESQLGLLPLEFGELRNAPEGFLARLWEHGKCIANGRAADLLRDYFG